MIIGATASGKSDLAFQLAQRVGGEIASADAMAVYRGMDIGTAKPDAGRLAAVPHHLISCIDPWDRCDVSRWLGMADAVISDIASRGCRPIVAGGSPLYAKALREGLSAGAPRDEAIRASLSERYDREGPDAMHRLLMEVDPVYGRQHHGNDRRRLIRALEVHALTGAPYSSFHTTDGASRERYRFTVIGLSWDKERLHERINSRARTMFAQGLVEEVVGLRDRMSPEAQQAVGYKEVLGFLAGEYDLAHAMYLVQRRSRLLAKHQATWYRRFPGVGWIPGDDPDLVGRALGLLNPVHVSQDAVLPAVVEPGSTTSDQHGLHS